MSSLTGSFKTTSLEAWHFLAIFTISLFVSVSIFIGITIMWQFFRQKISDEISARATKIANDLSAHDTKTFNAELGRIYAEINKTLLQKSEKSIHVMQATSRRRKKSLIT
jgi:F0F1-type ATP synthase membrane subunit b/b'